MHRRNRFYRLDLDHAQIFHKQIDTIPKIELQSMIDDGEPKLSFTKKTVTLQFVAKTIPRRYSPATQAPTRSEPSFQRR